MHLEAKRIAFPLVAVGFLLISPSWASPPPGPGDAHPKAASQPTPQSAPPPGPGSAMTPPPPGTEDDPSGEATSNPIYTDLPASMMLNADLAPAEGKPAPEQLLGRFIDLHSAMNYPAAAEMALK